MIVTEVAEFAAATIEGAGIAVIVAGALVSTVVAAIHLARRRASAYRDFRRMLGQSILIGLEFLVAADIVRTVAVSATLESVAVLAAIIVVRTFLSFSLELEITGRWPWQANPAAPARAQNGSPQNGSPQNSSPQNSSPQNSTPEE